MICKHCDFSCLSESVMQMHVEQSHVSPMLDVVTWASAYGAHVKISAEQQRLMNAVMDGHSVRFASLEKPEPTGLLSAAYVSGWNARDSDCNIKQNPFDSVTEALQHRAWNNGFLKLRIWEPK